MDTMGRWAGTARPGTTAAEQLFAGSGEMRARCRTLDWSATPLGPVEGWSRSLRTTAGIVLGSRNPMFLFWGPELVQIYNDAYRPSLGEGGRHPRALGMRGHDFWTDIWEVIGPQIAQVMGGGEATWHEDQHLPIERNGRLEDVWWTYSYSPVRDDDGSVGGTLVVCQETTSRVHAERALVLERERLDAVFRQSPSFLAVLRGPDNVFERVNAAYAQLVGHGREVVGRPLFDALPETRGQGFDTYMAQVRATGEPLVFRDLPVLLERTPGATLEERFLDVTYLPLVEPDGSREAVIAHGTDVTDQVRARREAERLREAAEAARAEVVALAERLRASEARFRDAFEQGPAAVAVLEGPLQLYTLVSPTYEEWAGRGPLAGRTFLEALPDLAGSAFDRAHQRVYATGAPETVYEEPVVMDRDGDGVPEEYVFTVHYAPLRDAAGAVYAVTSLVVDVTGQVRARRELETAHTAAEAARERSEAVLASIADPFYLLDREWRFTYVNDAAEPLLQTTRAALLGRTLWEAFPGVAGSEFEGPYREAMETGRPTAAEAYFEPLQTWFDVRTYAWSGGLMVHFRDVGARKAAEAERERLLADAQAARREAETANRVKSEFLAVMSHELRTPLNAIGGYAELLEMGIRGPVTEHQREDLRRVQSSQRHLLGLINEVLNYAKLETGTVHYNTVDVPLREVLAAAEALVAPQARAKALVLVVSDCPPGLAARVDGEKLLQILVNLLSNAVKFTDAASREAGRIELSCAAEGAHVVIRVQDTGIGIAPDKLTAIFDPFVQVRADLTRTAEGTGLGLAISRDLARGMGGDLTVESQVGVGSRFTLTLPRAGS